MAAVELLIEARQRELAPGFSIRRILPFATHRNVGPFVFLDHMGPVDAGPHGIADVRPHPHIGLATVTWLFSGEIVHRDSLGFVQPIRPGELNWMSAGKAITHSERMPENPPGGVVHLHGVQAWVALPAADQEGEPSFTHVPAGEMPVVYEDGVRLTVIAGTAFGTTAPMQVPSPLFYVEARFDPGASLALDADYAERGAYVVQGCLRVGEQEFGEGTLAVFAPGETVTLTADTGTLAMLLGGAPLDGPRHIYWNFVSTERDLIETAREDWKAGRFPRVPGETEFIPLPE